MSRAPPPVTPSAQSNFASTYPPYVQSNLQMASALQGYSSPSQAPVIQLQGPMAPNVNGFCDPYSVPQHASVMQPTFQQPIQVPVVDFAPGALAHTVNAAVPFAPQQAQGSSLPAFASQAAASVQHGSGFTQNTAAPTTCQPQPQQAMLSTDEILRRLDRIEAKAGSNVTQHSTGQSAMPDYRKLSQFEDAVIKFCKTHQEILNNKEACDQIMKRAHVNTNENQEMLWS